MRSRDLVVIGISIIVTLGVILSNYSLEFDDFAVFLCDSWFFSDSVKCAKIWEDPECHSPGRGCIFPKKTPFEQFTEKKAIAAFNLKLDDYRIISEVHAAYPAYTTRNHKAFVAQAVADDDVTNYYLSTSFIPEESLDEINVEIYKIISEKCDISLIRKGSGCESKYLEAVYPTPYSSLDGWGLGDSKGEPDSFKLIRNDGNLYCGSTNVELSDQCHHLEEIVFGNARKDWTVYPGGAGWTPPSNSTLVRIYNEAGFGVPSLNFTAMLNDKIFVNRCESNSGIWNYTYHDCEDLWQVCRDVEGIVIQEDITPPCTDTGIIDDDSLTIKICRGAEIIRVICVFEYQN